MFKATWAEVMQLEEAVKAAKKEEAERVAMIKQLSAQRDQNSRLVAHYGGGAGTAGFLHFSV